MERMEELNLKAYLANMKLKIKDFAELIDRTPSYVGAIASGRVNPSYHTAEHIKQITGGRVIIEPSEKSSVVKKASRRAA